MAVAVAGSLEAQHITTLLVALAVLLGAARLMGELAIRFRQPAILGEILSGILLGPTLLGWVWPHCSATVFPIGGPERMALEGFLAVAVTLLLLVAGLEVDLSTVVRQGRAAISVSFTGIFFPFFLGLGLAWMLPHTLGMEPGARPLTFALFIGIALSITALPVIAKTLMDLNMLKSAMGMTIISAAMVDDLLGWIGFAIVMALMQADGAGGGGTAQSDVLWTIGLTLGYLVLMLTLGRALFHRLLPVLQAHTSWPGGVLGFVLVVALLGGAFTEYIGIHAIFGAFIAGVAIGDSSHLRERTRDTIHQFVTNIFAPVFFASIGLRISFIESFDPVLVVVVLAVAIVSKVGGCFIGGLWAGMSRRESLAIGFGMAGRGAMEIILAQLALSAGLITERLFVAIVIMALVTSLISGPMMQRLLLRPVRRTLLDRLGERHVVLGMRAQTVAHAIRLLAQRAAEISGLDAAGIQQAVMARQEIGPTGIGEGIAVPHARLPALKDSLIVIGRNEVGLDFDAPDGQPARLICLLLTPAHDATVQVELLGDVAGAFATAATRRRALEAQNFTQFRAALRIGKVQQPPGAA